MTAGLPMALLAGLAACAAREDLLAGLRDSAAAGGADTALAGDDSGGEDGEPAPDPWDDPEYWAEPGPFAPLLDMDLAPQAYHWEMWVAVSEDGETWDTPAWPVAHAFSSLDILNWRDIGLIIVGSTVPNAEIGVEAPDRHLFAITTPDLERWGSHSWEVEDTRYPLVTDPSLRLLDDGTVRAAYVSFAAKYGSVAPEEVPGPHPVYQADRDGEVFREIEGTLVEMEQLVDPVVCDWGDEGHLFGTVGPLVGHADGPAGLGPLVEDDAFFWGDAQVPFCWERDGRRLVIAQAGGGDGIPTWREYLGDGEFTDPAEFFEEGADPFDGRCTSPVLAEFQGRWVMACGIWSEPATAAGAPPVRTTAAPPRRGTGAPPGGSARARAPSR